MNEKKIVSGHTETSPLLLKNFFRTYYSEKYKTVKTVTLILAVILFIVSAALYYNGFGLIFPALCVWAGLVMIVYPRTAYRRPYKKMKDMKTTTYFDFYEDKMTERSNGKSESFIYGDIYKTLETNQYFYIFHSPEMASVLEKKDISVGNADMLRDILKSKTEYKRKK